MLLGWGGGAVCYRGGVGRCTLSGRGGGGGGGGVHICYEGAVGGAVCYQGETGIVIVCYEDGMGWGCSMLSG